MNFKQLEKYNYLIRIDDDSWFKKKIDYNLFDKLKESKKFESMDTVGMHTWHHMIL